MFIRITKSHKFSVIPKVNIVPVKRIKPNLPFDFASISFLLISSLISFGNLSFLLERLIQSTSYFLSIKSSSINFLRHSDISLILSEGKNHIWVNGLRVSFSEQTLLILVNIVFSPSSSFWEPEIYLNIILTSFSKLNFVFVLFNPKRVSKQKPILFSLFNFSFIISYLCWSNKLVIRWRSGILS